MDEKANPGLGACFVPQCDRMAVRVRETGNMGAVSEMMDDDQRDDGRDGYQRQRGRDEKRKGGGKILAAWKLEANPNPSNPRMDPT